MISHTYSNLKIGLALGSGAGRGWAHIGVIKALAEHGIYPDIVAGCSIVLVVVWWLMIVIFGLIQ